MRETEQHEDMERRTIWVPPELWRRAKQAAREEAARTGEDVGLGEWVRRAIAERLERRSRT